jgi:peptide/nickel transport system substrate-binding protein
LPSHLYAADFSDIMTSPENQSPTVSAGPFIFKEWVRDDHVTFVRNPTYWKGAPKIDALVFKNVQDPGARLAQFATGDLDLMGVEPAQRSAVEQMPHARLNSFESTGYMFLIPNLGNPANPQPGRDESGSLIEQDPHPILGDVRVRKAIAHSIDYDSIINNVMLGQGYRMAANVSSTLAWAYNATAL